MNEEENGVKNQLKEKGKQEIEKKKKALKRKAFRIALPYIVVILIILFIASALYATFSATVDLIKNIGQTIVNIFTVKDTGIEISEEQLDKLIAGIEASGVDLEDLELLRRH